MFATIQTFVVLLGILAVLALAVPWLFVLIDIYYTKYLSWVDSKLD